MLELLFTSVLGALSAYGFFNPAASVLIPLCLFLFLYINKEMSTTKFGVFFISLNTFGSLWLIVPIHFIGGVNYTFSILVIILLGSFMGGIYALIFKFMKRFNKDSSKLIFIIPTTIIISEFIKLHIIGGYPFLLYGYYFIDSFLKVIIPFVGLYGCSWLLVMLCSLLAYTLQQKKYTSLISIISILLCLKMLHLESPIFVKNQDKLKMYIVHTDNHYPNKHIKEIPSIKIHEKVDITLYPETMFSHTNQIPSIHSNYILTGLITYDRDKQGFYNTMVGINKENKIDFIHKKYHLAQFNEWIPNGIQIILKTLNLPYHGFIAGNGLDTNGKTKDTKFMSTICYEMLFASFIYSNINDANIIFSINDLGWFEKSMFENHFYQITRFMSALTQKPIVISSNVGSSAIVDAKANIMYYKENVFVEVQTNHGNTPWMIYGDNLILSFIFIINFLLFILTKKTSLKEIEK